MRMTRIEKNEKRIKALFPEWASLNCTPALYSVVVEMTSKVLAAEISRLEDLILQLEENRKGNP